ncbi:Pisatin demethylase, partial [Colletotrichum shisoi]
MNGLPGPIVRYGPNRFSFSDAESPKTIYGHGTQFPKSDFYTTFQPSEDMWNMFADRDIKHHAHTRRFSANAYSMGSLIHYEPYLNECGALFSQHLLEFSNAGTAADFGHWFQCFAFDAIALITYGKRLGFLDRGEDIANVIDNLDNNLLYASLMGIFPALHKFAMPLLAMIDARIGSGTGIRSPRPNTKKTAPRAAVGETFLSKFLAKHSHNPDEYTNFHVLTGCASNMFAGSDTTGISLSAILYNLLKNPDSMGKLREEIDDFTRRGELSQAPSFQETSKMPYLQAVIKEALRIHPARGSIVGINSWVQHRNKTLFGEDAEYFRPDRWLISDEARLSVMNRNWMPFGLGSRTCMGKNISMLEMSKLIPRIIRDFEFKLEGTSAMPGCSWETHNAWFVKPRKFYAT